ncbi:Elongator protein 3/MiaB/NifB [Acididesulfobacillus acetoxydans]|uniref:Elongator protein 3/MiaB/NifB n=1 Tax=Acididesulfobacillus acetoxydans TaxID=1561005 RepID=A0A8S0W266_9FIRM|nr:radical SAM protein [Acididesulfobacillus acetoxydans]CAA7600448.1 Elongator protein 3/MiaB/NifB [Acididesulfobacillus acetoxydans]CEJ06582.1 Fe-S oxidoreductase [Acididesulfobacillus acetoxydans]
MSQKAQNDSFKDSFYEGVIYRPPSEASSLILQVTVGCRHNQCTFCGMYKGKSFRIKSEEEIRRLIEMGQAQYPLADRIFLADGDALTLDTELQLSILGQLYRKFPRLKRVGIYGGPKDILAKSPQELDALKRGGLGIVYLGVESGSPVILRQVKKGVTLQEMALAGQRIVAAGLKLSCTVILGLGGKELSREHALGTAQILSAIDPHYLGALTLMPEPGAPLYRRVKSGEFKQLTAWETLHELYEMIEPLEVTDCLFRSNHASNYLSLKAHLPQEKQQLLQTLARIIGQAQSHLLRPEDWRGL